MARLKSARLKLQRALEHLYALDLAIDRHLDSKPHRITEYLDEDGWNVVQVEVTHDFPAHVGVIAGDAAHNLRSALDHVVYAVTIGAKARENCVFPISTEKSAYLSPRGKPPCQRPSMRDEALSGVPLQLIPIIDAVQPYHDGGEAKDNALACVVWLDNRDKHRTVQPAFATIHDLSAVHIEAPPEHEADLTWEWIGTPGVLEVGKKTDVLRWRTTPAESDMKVTRIEPRLDIRLGKRASQRKLAIAYTKILDEVIAPVETEIGRRPFPKT